MFFISGTSSCLSTIAGIPSDEENAIIMKFLAVSIKLTISAWLKQSCSNLAPAFEQSTIETKQRQKLLMSATFQPFRSCEASQKVTALYFKRLDTSTRDKINSPQKIEKVFFCFTWNEVIKKLLATFRTLPKKFFAANKENKVFLCREKEKISRGTRNIERKN